MSLEKRNVPTLRFPSFKEEWKKFSLNKLLERVSEPVEVFPDKLYQEIGIRSHGKGVFHKEPVKGEALGEKRVFHVVPGTLAFNIVFAWEQALAELTEEESGYIASHRFPMFRGVKRVSDVSFFKYFFLRPRGKYLLALASPGGAGRNKTLGQKEFGDLIVSVPTIEEQRKIVMFLGVVDKKITQLQKKKDLLEEYKKGCMQKLFSQDLRFTDDNGKPFPDWGKKSLENILDYEQPTKYLVSSTEYSEAYTVPVLTAGKTFILGYTNEKSGIYKDNLPTIIFDDFTTAFHYVDFPFKAKSSAMKMLTLKNSDDNLKFVHAAMTQINFTLGEHKRYWIAEYQKEKIPYPHPDEQKKIADFLSAIDDKIVLVTETLDKAKTFKKGLLQQMLL